MSKLLTVISIIIFSLTYAPRQVFSQVITGIGDFQLCYHASTIMPIVVQNMNGVDSLKIVLAFDKNAVTFIEHFGVNAALIGGVFSVANENDSIVITWTQGSSSTLANDTLVWLKFEGLIGSTTLHWSISGSYYHTSSGNTPAIFLDGSAVVAPKINTTITEIDATCAKLCEANYMANASGGKPPYSYKWDGAPGRFDSIQTGLCSGKRLLSIIDTWGCRLDTNYVINGMPGANVKLIIEGNEDTTIYLENPVLSFRFEENYPTHVVEPPVWFFGDGDSAVSFNPTHLYSRANTNTDGYYVLKLIVKNENGCDSTIEVTIKIKDADLKIPGVITPNGDSFNESFLILNQNKVGSGEDIKITTEFQRMELLIYDRWGRKIYDDSNYQSDWHAKGVPDGVYYFKLKTVGYYNTELYKGSITILGSGNNN